MTKPPRWTDEHKQTVTAMWLDGKTATAIAEWFTAAGMPATKNAIIGLVHRLRLPTHYVGHDRSRPLVDPSKPRRPKKWRASRAKPKPARVTVTAAPKPAKLPRRPVHLLRLPAHGCKWAVGWKGGHLFCGKQRLDGSSYCAEHTALAHQPQWRRSA